MQNKSGVNCGSTQRASDQEITGVGRGPHALGKNAITVIFCMCTNWRIACQDVHLQSEACRGIIAPICVCRQIGGRAVQSSTCRSVLRCSQPHTTQVDKVTWRLSRAPLATCVHRSSRHLSCLWTKSRDGCQHLHSHRVCKRPLTLKINSRQKGEAAVKSSTGDPY